MPFSQKLTEEQVREIRLSPLSARKISKQYGVSHPTILNIRDGRTYKSIGAPPAPGTKNIYVNRRPLEFLEELPSGICGTAVAAPPKRARPIITSDDDENDERKYVEEQRSIIRECLRIVGPTGILLYHYGWTLSAKRGILLRTEILEDFPLHQAITWHHGMKRFIPGGPHLKRLPNDHKAVYILAGPRWSIPERSHPKAMEWGDCWQITPNASDMMWERTAARKGNAGTPRDPFPDELADRCIALGEGTVLNPYAGTGAVPLAAIRAGRDWIASDIDSRQKKTFELRRGNAHGQANSPHEMTQHAGLLA